MSDRELLELAAKAAGYLIDFNGPFCQIYIGNGLVIHRDSNTRDWKPWNPLTDDGDALRLAVKLCLEVNTTIYDKPTVSVYGNSKGMMVSAHEYRVPCIMSSVRRAIVHVAAEIENTPQGE